MPTPGSVRYSYFFNYETVNIQSDDAWEGELDMLAFPIAYLHHIDNILELFNYKKDVHYFYKQCWEVISVPEKHQNEKGEGKLNFQVYFHNFPYSMLSLNDQATVVVILRPMGGEAEARDYDLVGYIHANEFNFNSQPIEEGTYRAYYYNMLRISERAENGVRVYRRKRIFAMLFAVLLDLVEQNDIHYIYAAMGKENQAINDALVMLADRHNKHYDKLAIKSCTKINKLYGSSRYAKRLVDITHDRERRKELYERNLIETRNYVFNQYSSVEVFQKMLDNLFEYSESSRIYMLPGSNGEMKAACICSNWGDYLEMTLDNPKGIFKLYDKLKLTKALLYNFFVVGDPQSVEKLFKGAAHLFRKNHNCQITIMNTQKGDPLYKAKDSLIYDDFTYFVIQDRMDNYNAFKEHSKDEKGNIRLFVDNPIY